MEGPPMALEKVDAILSKWDSVEHPDIHAIGSSLKQLKKRIEDVLDFEAKVQAVLKYKSKHKNRNVTKATRRLIKAWCQSYLDIERVLLCVLALFGITLDPLKEDAAGISSSQRVLETFDNPSNPVHELLGSQRRLASEFSWSETWKDGPAMTGRNPGRDAIDTLRLFKEWWPTSGSSKDPAPEFLGSGVAPPENYEVWFGCILKDLILALEVCNEAKLKKVDPVVASNERISTEEFQPPLAPVNELATLPATISYVADPQASSSSSSPGSSSLADSRVSQEVSSLRNSLNKTIRERESARDDRTHARLQRDDARRHLYMTQERLDETSRQLHWTRQQLDETNLQLHMMSQQRDEAQGLLLQQEANIVRASQDAEEEIWCRVRAAIASDQFFDLVRRVVRRDA